MILHRVSTVTPNPDLALSLNVSFFTIIAILNLTLSATILIPEQIRHLQEKHCQHVYDLHAAVIHTDWGLCSHRCLTPMRPYAKALITLLLSMHILKYSMHAIIFSCAPRQPHKTLIWSGSTDAGHYYAYIRHAEPAATRICKAYVARGHTWFKFDDHHVTHAKFEDVVKVRGSGSS